MSRTTPVTSTVALVTAVALAAAFAPAVDRGPVLAPEPVPDRGAVLAEPIRRGEVLLEDVAPRTPSTRTIDGDAGDWIGEATRVGGASRFDAGELIHSDFLFDAHGADDGGDRQRLEDFAGLLHEETRTERIDQVLRTSGSQLGVPEPLGAPDEYGDADGGLDVADVTEVRLGSDGEDLQLLVSVANLTDPSRLGVLLLADRGRDGVVGGGGSIGFGGLTTDRFDTAVFARDGAVSTNPPVVQAIGPGQDEPEPLWATATGADGWENHLELAVDLDLLATDDGTIDVAVVAGRVEDDGSLTPLNVAFRGDEPVEIFNDRAQAFALLDSTVDAFSSGPVAISDLTGGRTQAWDFGPGYHERQFTSGENISAERGDDGVAQPYGLYVPTAYEATEEPLPVTYWLHYRGGKAHSGTVINPRQTTQLGEERGNLMVFPHGRGTSEWYVTESHQDVFEVMADAEATFKVDETRRYVSGYSMGGYGSWLFGSLYPDLFAAAHVVSGAITQGAWVGTGAEGDPVDPLQDQGWIEANDGDARAQLTYRAIENLRHVPFAIDHGTDDELVPITQIERVAQKLTELGYPHRLTRFLGYEHFTQAIMDEWADGAAYLDQFTIDPNPRQVTYAVVPALVHALNTVDPAQGATFDYDPDGAYWVDGIEVRDPGERGDGSGRPSLAAKGTVQATSLAIAAPGLITAPDAGAVSPVGHSTPFIRTGLQHIEDPSGLTAPAVSNGLELDLTNVAAVAVDTARASLDVTAGDVAVAITTDGPTTVRLVGGLVPGSTLAGLVGTTDGAGTYTADGEDLLVVVDSAGSLTLGG